MKSPRRSSCMTGFASALILMLSWSSVSSQNPKEFPVLKGPYLGQEPPGSVPVVFAPGIISTRANEHSFPAFSPDGSEVFWSAYNDAGDFQTIYHMKQLDGVWTAPAVAEFSGEVAEGNVAFNHAGDKIFFSSDAAMTAEGKSDMRADIWFRQKGPEGWSEKKNVGAPLNTKEMEFFPYLTRNNVMYLQGTLKGVQNDFGIFRSEFKDGHFSEKVPLGEAINTPHLDWTPCVDPDETFMIFSSTRPGGIGSGDLYVSFKTADGEWGTPRNMGPEINTEHMERFPGLSPDGKYLFFIRGFGDIYWVDAAVIEETRSSSACPRGERD
jgi:hypothetical protein